jgi:hypothetical protein
MMRQGIDIKEKVPLVTGPLKVDGLNILSNGLAVVGDTK